jgi:hypothetical protein
MADNYEKIVQNNLDRLYTELPVDFSQNLPGKQDGKGFVFDAFGEKCRIEPDKISFNGKQYSSVLGIIISLYALNARPDTCILEPFKAFKEFPDSTPYVGAFATHTEQVLAPHVDKIKKSIPLITDTMKGDGTKAGSQGDFSFVVYPLPKIALYYIFYEADEDFSASVTCLFSNNARLFLPVDGLADLGEYCSKTILSMIGIK